MAAFERATVGLFLWWTASAALGNDTFEQLSASSLAVGEAAERIEQAARSRGLRVLARTDYSSEARRAGYRLRPMQALEIDMRPGARPARLIVWQAADGATIISVDGDWLRDAGTTRAQLPDIVGAGLGGRSDDGVA